MKLTAAQAAALAVVTLMLCFGVSYSWLTWQGKVTPVLATWMLFCVATSLSFWTYWSTEKHSLMGNIGNTIDLMVAWLILGAILVLGKDIRLGFNPFEISCLVASGVILTFWKLTKQHVAANLALQGVMAIAFLPTLYQLWHATQNTETFGLWLIVWIATCLALIPAWMKKDRLAMVYVCRGIIFVTVLLGLMIRIEIR
jgi:hypothetical protein